MDLRPPPPKQELPPEQDRLGQADQVCAVPPRPRAPVGRPRVPSNAGRHGTLQAERPEPRVHPSRALGRRVTNKGAPCSPLWAGTSHGSPGPPWSLSHVLSGAIGHSALGRPQEEGTHAPPRTHVSLCVLTEGGSAPPSRGLQGLSLQPGVEVIVWLTPDANNFHSESSR